MMLAKFKTSKKSRKQTLLKMKLVSWKINLRKASYHGKAKDKKMKNKRKMVLMAKSRGDSKLYIIWRM